MVGKQCKRNTETYVFCSALIQRWDILLKHVDNLTVKSLSQTQQYSRINAIEIYEIFYPFIIFCPLLILLLNISMYGI